MRTTVIKLNKLIFKNPVFEHISVNRAANRETIIAIAYVGKPLTAFSRPFANHHENPDKSEAE